MDTTQQSLTHDAIELLKKLIATPSFSKEEANVCLVLQQFLSGHNIDFHVHLNNIWACNRFYDSSKPTVLLNSHHDTVQPNPGYTKDPFTPFEEDGKLYGLGSNDAGGCLVSLIATFLYFYEQEDLQYNLVLALTAEEENSGYHGMYDLFKHLPKVDVAIVGEPTKMHIAIAERGLMVLKGTVKGKAGHAARGEGLNAITLAMEDIEWIMQHPPERVSETLGASKMTVTMIEAGTQHNVVPDHCTYTIDVRLTEQYTTEEVITVLSEKLHAAISTEGMVLPPSFIDPLHPLVTAAKQSGAVPYGSPTTSDQAVIPVPSVKMGPGDSARSHTANEFIYVDEIKDGIARYIEILKELLVKK